jgi:hypothetical protein
MVFVNGVHPELLSRIGVAVLPAFLGHSQDGMAQLLNEVGLYRFGLPTGPAPAPPPEGMTSAEWNTVWHLTHSSKALSALMQEIGARQLTRDEAGAAGTLGDRPVVVLGGKNFLPSGRNSVWEELQNDLARLSTRGKLVMVDKGGDDLIYRAPGAIIEAIREVLGEVTSAPDRR